MTESSIAISTTKLQKSFGSNVVLKGLDLSIPSGSVFAIVGLTAKSVEVVQQGSFIWVFPLTFVSSAFVPTESMPSWLRLFADNQPVTHVVEAVRALLLNQPIGNHGWISAAWSVGILLIAFPIASAIFRRQAR